MDNKISITTINGQTITAIEHEGEYFVPVKPICEAIGIEPEAQRIKIKEDEILSSAATIIVAVGADGKQREMLCLPVKYIYGWLFTINPGKVAPSAREKVSKYRRECYEVLYSHFHNSLSRQLEANEAEIALLSQINEALSAEKDAKARRKKLENSLETLRKQRLDSAPALF